MLNFQGVHVGCFCFLFKPCVFFNYIWFTRRVCDVLYIYHLNIILALSPFFVLKWLGNSFNIQVILNTGEDWELTRLDFDSLTTTLNFHLGTHSNMCGLFPRHPNTLWGSVFKHPPPHISWGSAFASADIRASKLTFGSSPIGWPILDNMGFGGADLQD